MQKLIHYKSFFFIFFIFSALPFLKSQSSTFSDGQNRLKIGFVMPDEIEALNYSQFQKLETRILRILSTHGITSQITAARIKDSNNIEIDLLARGIFCYPRFEIYEEETANAGMGKRIFLKVILSLFIQNIDQDVIFGSVSVNLVGSGANKEQALTSIINSINVHDNMWHKFLQNSRVEIIEFYNNNCEKLLQQAIQLDNLNLTAEAIALLWPIPSEIDCYKEVQAQSFTIYSRYINSNCQYYILQAKTYLAANNFEESLRYLSKINPGSDSSCAKDAKQMIEKIGVEIDSIGIEKLSLYREFRESDIDLEKYRLDKTAAYDVTEKSRPEKTKKVRAIVNN